MKIIIVGAGIGGLTLAAFLNKQLPSASVCIFERDASATARSQGYSISLRGDMGLKVLDALGLPYESCGSPARSMLFTTTSGRELMNLRPMTSDKTNPYFIYQVRRPDLRDLLLSAIDNQNTTITYGAAVESYESGVSEDGGCCRIHLAGGGSADADFVVVADGSRSRLRKQFTKLPSDPPLGITLITGKVDMTRIPASDKVTTGNTLFMIGRGESFFGASATPSTGAWSVGVHSEDIPKEVREEPESESAAALLTYARNRASTWAQPCPNMISATPVDSVKTVEILDVKPLHTAVDGKIVFIGDACHPMTPFQGLGANTAMVDAMDVANYLSSTSPFPSLNALGLMIAERGAKNVAASRSSALKFHERSYAWGMWRNASFWLLGCMLNMMTPRLSGASAPPPPSSST